MTVNGIMSGHWGILYIFVGFVISAIMLLIADINEKYWNEMQARQRKDVWFTKDDIYLAKWRKAGRRLNMWGMIFLAFGISALSVLWIALFTQLWGIC